MSQTAQFETITPAMAKDLLSKNTKNRKINDSNLNGLIIDIKKGHFHLTGESIKIAKDGTLLDGQHRLMAIVKTGQPIKTLVVRGLDNEAFKHMDTGRKRQASDVLAIEGFKNPGKIAAMTKFIINFKRGQFYSVAERQSTKSVSRITNNDVSEFVQKNQALLYDSYPYGFNKYNKLISGVTLSAIHFILRGIHEAQADDFCHKIAEGQDITKDSSIYLLRQKLLSDIRSTRKMSQLEKIALICKAWNLYRGNKKVQLLKWDSVKEPFPKPI